MPISKINYNNCFQERKSLAQRIINIAEGQLSEFDLQKHSENSITHSYNWIHPDLQFKKYQIRKKEPTLQVFGTNTQNSTRSGRKPVSILKKAPNPTVSITNKAGISKAAKRVKKTFKKHYKNVSDIPQERKKKMNGYLVGKSIIPHDRLFRKESLKRIIHSRKPTPTFNQSRRATSVNLQVKTPCSHGVLLENKKIKDKTHPPELNPKFIIKNEQTERSRSERLKENFKCHTSDLESKLPTFDFNQRTFSTNSKMDGIKDLVNHKQNSFPLRNISLTPEKFENKRNIPDNYVVEEQNYKKIRDISDPPSPIERKRVHSDLSVHTSHSFSPSKLKDLKMKFCVSVTEKREKELARLIPDFKMLSKELPKLTEKANKRDDSKSTQKINYKSFSKTPTAMDRENESFNSFLLCKTTNQFNKYTKYHRKFSGFPKPIHKRELNSFSYENSLQTNPSISSETHNISISPHCQGTQRLDSVNQTMHSNCRDMTPDTILEDDIFERKISNRGKSKRIGQHSVLLEHSQIVPIIADNSFTVSSLLKSERLNQQRNRKICIPQHSVSEFLLKPKEKSPDFSDIQKGLPQKGALPGSNGSSFHNKRHQKTLSEYFPTYKANQRKNSDNSKSVFELTGSQARKNEDNCLIVQGKNRNRNENSTLQKANTQRNDFSKRKSSDRSRNQILNSFRTKPFNRSPQDPKAPSSKHQNVLRSYESGKPKGSRHSEPKNPKCSKKEELCWNRLSTLHTHSNTHNYIERKKQSEVYGYGVLPLNKNSLPSYCSIPLKGSSIPPALLLSQEQQQHPHMTVLPPQPQRDNIIPDRLPRMNRSSNPCSNNNGKGEEQRKTRTSLLSNNKQGANNCEGLNRRNARSNMKERIRTQGQFNLSTHNFNCNVSAFNQPSSFYNN